MMEGEENVFDVLRRMFAHVDGKNARALESLFDHHQRFVPPGGVESGRGDTMSVLVSKLNHMGTNFSCRHRACFVEGFVSGIGEDLRGHKSKFVDEEHRDMNLSQLVPTSHSFPKTFPFLLLVTLGGRPSVTVAIDWAQRQGSSEFIDALIRNHLLVE